MNNLKWKMIPILSLALLFMAGCASSAHIEKDPAVNLTDYRSFSWMNKDAKANDKNDLIERQIKNAVTNEMEKLGFRENKNKPDILIDYDVLVERSTRRESEPVYSQPYFRQFYNPYTRRVGTIYFPSQYMGSQDYQVPINEGTVTITMVDAASDKTIWQGWATNVVNSKHLTSKEVNSTVKSILRKLK